MGSNWENQIKRLIRQRYAHQYGKVCQGYSKALDAGYSKEHLRDIPRQITENYSGCGFIFEDIQLRGNETLVDLGCGSGLDSYIVSKKLRAGRVYALDMTYESLYKDKVQNIIPICADMEYLPIMDSCVDIVIANASFNLSTNQEIAFTESFRILKPCGSLIIRELIKIKELPAEIKTDPLSFITSVGGIVDEKKLLSTIENAGFTSITISKHKTFSYFKSVKIQAKKVKSTAVARSKRV